MGGDGQGAVRWIERLSREREALAELGRELKIHPLALEDCFHSNQRAKFDDFETHQLVVWFAYAAGSVHELEFVVFPQALLMVASEPPPQGASWQEYLKLNLNQCDGYHLLYHVLDRLTDLSADELQPVFDSIELFEEKLFEQVMDPRELIRHKRRLRRAQFSLTYLPTVAAQLQQFLKPRDDLRWRLRDLIDHAERTQQSVTFHLAQVSSAMDMYWGFTSQQVNDRIKKLTLLAAVSVPLSFWTSFWGMNFTEIPFNEPRLFHWALGLMALSGAVVYYLLRAKGYWERE